MTRNNDDKSPIQELVKLLNNDSSYRDMWKANISVCVLHSLFGKVSDLELCRNISNDAAEKFLTLLCKVNCE